MTKNINIKLKKEYCYSFYMLWNHYIEISWKILVQFRLSVVSDTLGTHGLQHTRPPSPSSTFGVYSNSCLLSQWWYPASHPLSSTSAPAFNLSQHQGLFNESVLRISWPKFCSFSFNISPSNEYSGLISFRMDWLDLLAVQGTLKSLLQHCSSKVSILRHSAFFRIQLSLPYMTTGKTIALTIWTFVGKVMSLLFNMLFRLVITFLPRSKWFLISWLKSQSAVILESPKIKSVTISIVSPSICHEVILVFWMLSFKPTISFSSFTFKRLFSSSLSAIGWYHLHIWGYWYFSQQSWFQLAFHSAQCFSWCTLHIS